MIGAGAGLPGPILVDDEEARRPYPKGERPTHDPPLLLHLKVLARGSGWQRLHMDERIMRREELLPAVPIPQDVAVAKRHHRASLVIPVGHQC